MATTKQYIRNIAQVKKVGDTLTIVSDGAGVLDEKSVIATGSETPRTLADRFADVINVKDFGAVGDGVTDDTDAIQSALDLAHSRGGAVVFFPSGKYLKNDTSNQLFVYSNTTILGTGDSSVIYFYDTDTNTRNDLFTIPNASEGITFENIKIKGTLNEFTNETNISVAVVGHRVNNIRFTNVTFESLRFFAVAMSPCRNVVYTGCSFIDIQRDGIHHEYPKGVRVVGCFFKRVADDAIALSKGDYEYEAELGNGNVIEGCVFEACQGVKSLGCKSIIINSNIFKRSLRTPIYIEQTEKDAFDFQNTVVISNNIILDTFGNRGTNHVIFINNNKANSEYGITEKPNQYSITTKNSVNVPAQAIKICNNIIGWTLPVNVQYSSYKDGYSSFEEGLLLDREGVKTVIADGAGFTDPYISASSYYCRAIVFYGSFDGVDISYNHIFGSWSDGSNLYAIEFNNSGATDLVIRNCNISNNTFYDWPSSNCIYIYGTQTAYGDINITNNTFDLDPYFKNQYHSSDNKWSSNTGCTAISAYNSNISGCVKENTFKNCSRTVSSNSMIISDNNVYFYPSDNGLDGKADNLGIRVVSFAHMDNHFIIDGDPTSSAYGKIITAPLKFSSSMPTSGTYIYGDFVGKVGTQVVTVDNIRKSVLGWRRLTTGSNHVSGVDWQTEYTVL